MAGNTFTLISAIARTLTVLGGCAPDFNTDNTVDSSDLAILLAAWGPCN